MIYADNSATTQLDQDAFFAMKPFLLSDFANASEPYSFSRNAKIALKDARKTIAECINAGENQICFTSGGSESDNFAIKGTAFCSQKPQAIIVSSIEHHAVLKTAFQCEKFGKKVFVVSSDKNGIITPEALEKTILQAKAEFDSIALISIMTANNEIGTIEPIKELAKVAKKHKILFHTDAVAAMGHIPLDVKSLDVDFLSASGHKFNAPKGCGFIFIKDAKTISPFITGGSQENNIRAGTENIASIVAMKVALKKACEEQNERKALLLSLEKELVSVLKKSEIDFVRNGKNQMSGILSLSFNGKDGEMLLHRLDLMEICVSTGSACNAGTGETSHVLKAIFTPENYAKGTIRISFGANNKAGDGKKIADAIIKIIQDKGNLS